MKKKAGCLLSILLAVALLVGGWLAFRALAIYMFEGLFRTMSSFLPRRILTASTDWQQVLARSIG